MDTRRFGDGAGDYNPLWRDEARAAANRFGMITAWPLPSGAGHG